MLWSRDGVASCFPRDDTWITWWYGRCVVYYIFLNTYIYIYIYYTHIYNIISIYIYIYMRMRDMISLGNEIEWHLISTIVFFWRKRPRIIWTLHEVMLNDVMLQYFDSPEILLQKESCQSLKKIHHFPLKAICPDTFPQYVFPEFLLSPNAQNPKHLCMIVLLCAKQCSNRISAQKVHQVRRLRWSLDTWKKRKSWLVHQGYKLTMKYITSNDSC